MDRNLVLNSTFAHIILGLLCVISRLLTTIHYIEDPESLRFALSLYKYDLSSFQPNFPGYPVFCFLAKLINLFVHNNSISFSILGGISLFLLILYSLKLLKIPLLSLEGFLLAFLLFFNPMTWLMSNRFTPDLLGAAFLLIAFYYLLSSHENSKAHLIGWFVTGLLAGVRLSFLPFLLIPCLYSIIKKDKKFFALASLMLGLFIGLVPVLIDTGFSSMLQIASLQSFGAFSDYGKGLSEQSGSFSYFIQNIWADGLGGYWQGRNLVTLLNSAGIIVCLFLGVIVILSFEYSREKIIIFCSGFFLYSIWIYFFQNIVDTDRHFIIFLPFLLMAISYGLIYFLVNLNYMTVKIGVAIFLLIYVWLSINLALQHKNPTAIAQVKEFLDSKEEKEMHVISVPLMNLYLEQQGVKAKFYSAESDQEEISKINSGKIFTVGHFPQLLKKQRKDYSAYQHNPFVNRIWPTIEVYQY